MDRLVCDTLVRAGLRVTLRPVVYSMDVTDAHYSDRPDRKGDISNAIYAFDADEVVRLCANTEDDTGTPATDIPFVRCSADKFGRLRDDEPIGVCLQHTVWPESERTPAEDSMQYFAVALMVSKL